MARKLWNHVEVRVRPADVVSFVVVGAYLLGVYAYLALTRQIRPGFSLRNVGRNLTSWPRAAFGLLRPNRDNERRKAA